MQLVLGLKCAFRSLIHWQTKARLFKKMCVSLISKKHDQNFNFLLLGSGCGLICAMLPYTVKIVVKVTHPFMRLQY